jgi:PAS domain S-box-containing protein
MRLNEPITNREVEFAADEPLVSRTDTGGRITFVNHAFIAVSGFTEKELLGAPHNVVRHPHMPKEAFADFWATLKAGRPWEGLVKNRTKTGDFYWVRANATPVVENGQVARVTFPSAPSRHGRRSPKPKPSIRRSPPVQPRGSGCETDRSCDVARLPPSAGSAPA